MTILLTIKIKKIMKKIFIFCACCATAIMASAAGELTLGTVYIDAEIAALDNIATALNDVEGVSATGTITYDVETKTLTLNEATVVVSLDKPVIRFSSWAEGVTIELIGENTLKNTYEGYVDCITCPTVAANSITITGEGKLNLSTKQWYPISLGGGKLTISNTTVVAASEQYNYGICYNSGTGGQLFIEKANLTTPDISALSGIQLTDCYIIQPANAEVVNDEDSWYIDKKGSSENIVISVEKGGVGTSVDNVIINAKNAKKIMNGQLVIEHDNNTYTLMGQIIK